MVDMGEATEEEAEETEGIRGGIIIGRRATYETVAVATAAMDEVVGEKEDIIESRKGTFGIIVAKTPIPLPPRLAAFFRHRTSFTVPYTTQRILHNTARTAHSCVRQRARALYFKTKSPPFGWAFTPTGFRLVCWCGNESRLHHQDCLRTRGL